MLLSNGLTCAAYVEGQNEEVYSVGSDGLILRWQGSSELNTDLFEIEDEVVGHEGSILCSTYSKDLGMLVTGSDDCTLRLWPVSEAVDAEPAGGIPDEDGDGGGAGEGGGGRGGASRGAGADDDGESLELRGHEARVTDVVELGDHMLASVSHDMTLRFWDLHTRHEMHCVHRAHDNPIHSVEHADAREEVATAAVDPTVKIWHAFKPFALKGVLAGHTGDVTAITWCDWRMLWITAAGDHTIRLWDPDMGETLRCLSIRGEAVTTMMLDPVNQCLVAAMLDRKIRLFDVAQLEGLKDRFGQWVGEGGEGGGEEEGEGGGGEGGGGEGGEGGGEPPMDEIQAELSGVSGMSSPRAKNNYYGGATVDDIAVGGLYSC
jgi:WD40 repeat protein